MKQKTKISSSSIIYDSLADTLTARFDNRNTFHSMNLHDIAVIDFSETNKIAGIEILDISELFDIKKSELKKVHNIILKVIYNEETKELLVKANIEFDVRNDKEIIIQPIKLNECLVV